MTVRENLTIASLRCGDTIDRALEQKHLRDEKIQSQQALRTSEIRFRSLVQNLSDIIYSFQGSVHQAHTLENFQFYYGATGAIGNYYINEQYNYYYPGGGSTNMPITSRGNRYFAGLGVSGGADFVIPFAREVDNIIKNYIIVDWHSKPDIIRKMTFYIGEYLIDELQISIDIAEEIAEKCIEIATQIYK